jgi:hypothetical protein
MMKFKEPEGESNSLEIGVIPPKGQEIQWFLSQIAKGWERSLSHGCFFGEESE